MYLSCVLTRGERHGVERIDPRIRTATLARRASPAPGRPGGDQDDGSSRLAAPAAPVQQPDALLDVEEAAARLGMSRSYLYRHASRFPFVRRVGRSLRFSVNGIENYLRQRRA